MGRPKKICSKRGFAYKEADFGALTQKPTGFHLLIKKFLLVLAYKGFAYEEIILYFDKHD